MGGKPATPDFAKGESRLRTAPRKTTSREVVFSFSWVGDPYTKSHPAASAKRERAWGNEQKQLITVFAKCVTEIRKNEVRLCRTRVLTIFREGHEVRKARRRHDLRLREVCKERLAPRRGDTRTVSKRITHKSGFFIFGQFDPPRKG